MKARVIEQAGGRGVLQLRDIPDMEHVALGLDGSQGRA